MTVNIPESEINWLYGLDEEYRVKINNSYTVFSINILPPTLKKWVKDNYRATDYINMGPSIGTNDGMIWKIWGWNKLPKESGCRNIDWENSILAESPTPTHKDLEEKIKQIQTNLNELTSLVRRINKG